MSALGSSRTWPRAVIAFCPSRRGTALSQYKVGGRGGPRPPLPPPPTMLAVVCCVDAWGTAGSWAAGSGTSCVQAQRGTALWPFCTSWAFYLHPSAYCLDVEPFNKGGWGVSDLGPPQLPPPPTPTGMCVDSQVETAHDTKQEQRFPHPTGEGAIWMGQTMLPNQIGVLPVIHPNGANGPWLAHWPDLFSRTEARITTRKNKFPFSPETILGGIGLVKNVGKKLL